MDHEVVNAVRKSASKSTRAAKIQVFSAVLFAISAGIFFLGNKPLLGLLQCFISCVLLSSALRLRWKTKQLSSYIDGTAER